VIRFSAGLVVVAIGVLIGGVVTSKLSLVYVAIAVSAVALVVLAIGVALKRDELFGGGPELAPAGAGAGSGIPVGHSVGAGDVRGKAGRVREDQQQIQPKKVPGPATAAFEAAAAAQTSALAASASTAAPTVAAPSVTTPVTTTPPVTSPTVGSPTRGPAEDNSPFGNPPLANRRAAFSQASAPEGDSAADWQTRSPQPPWSSGDQVRSAWTPEEQTPIAAPPPTVPQSGAAAVSPRPWGSPDQSPAPTTRAESGTVAPSWFDRLNKPAAVPVAQTRTDQATVVDPAKAEPQQAEPQQAEPTKAADPSDAVTDTDIDDDDWPTRYSWLDDDETDEAAEADKLAEISDVAEVAGTVPADATAVEPVVAEPAVAESDSPDAESADADAEDHGATTDDVETAADPANETDDTAETDEPGATLAVDAAHKDGDEDEDADEPPAPQPVGSKLVTVIPGVPRYHDPDCILIRFMDEEDIARKSIPEAKAANCTPCAACQPEG
jgi:hypothetical protein